MEYNAVDVGALYHFSDGTRLGLMIKNVYGFSFKDKYEVFRLPKYLTIGVSSVLAGYAFSFDSEYIFGTFSGLKRKRVEIWFLRLGIEKEFSSWFTGRIGCIYPAIARTSSLGDIKDDMPWPKVGGALGAGIKFRRFFIDASLYGDPAKSYVKQGPVISAVVSVTVPF